MSVTYVEPLWSGRTGEDGITRARTYTQMFEVRTSDNADDVTVVGGPQAAALGMPRNGQPYPFDSRALMIKIRPTQNDLDPTLWNVACEYSTELPRKQAGETQSIDPDTGESKESPTGQDPTARPENPLDRDPIYKFTHEKHEEPAKFTANGTRILNCADDPFDPPIMVKRSLGVVAITKNYARINTDWLDQFVDSVNIKRWNGRKKRTCIIDAADAEPHKENGVNFWTVNFRIIVNRLTWDHFVIEQGWNEKKNVAGNWVRSPIKIPTDTSGRAGDRVPLLDGAFASGFTYATDYVKADDGTAGGIKDGSNPAIPGVNYIADKDSSGNLNDGTKGRGAVLANGLDPRYSRWRVQPEMNFSLLGI